MIKKQQEKVVCLHKIYDWTDDCPAMGRDFSSGVECNNTNPLSSEGQYFVHPHFCCCSSSSEIFVCFQFFDDGIFTMSSMNLLQKLLLKPFKSYLKIKFANFCSLHGLKIKKNVRVCNGGFGGFMSSPKIITDSALPH